MKKVLFALLALLEPDMVHRSGEKVELSGIYKSGSIYIAISKGERFPPSTKHWSIVTSINN